MGSTGPLSSSAASDAALWQQKVYIAAVVAAYFVISISLVFVNKLLMDRRWSIDAPLFMTWYQCVVTVVICWALGEAGTSAGPTSWLRQFPRFVYRWDVARKVMPLSVIFVGMITFNNLCLKYVEVSFYNVARSLTIVFNVVLTWYMLGTRTSWDTIKCLAVVVLGFFVGSGSEVNFSLLGTVFGVTSSLFVSLNSIQTKKAVEVVGGNDWTLAGYNNMNALLMFIPLILITGEGAVLLASVHLLTSSYYWLLMTVGGVFGFLIGIVTIMQIKATSPLTYNISGTAKACVQTVLALVIWGNATNFWNMMGVLMVLLGSMAYSRVRSREMDAEAKAKQERAEQLARAAEVDNGKGEAGGSGGDAVVLTLMDGSSSGSSAASRDHSPNGTLLRTTSANGVTRA